MEFLYSDSENTTPDEPLYTIADTIEKPDSTIGDYPILKTLTSIAVNEPSSKDKINFDNHVEQNWRKTVVDNNELDKSVASDAASKGNTSLVETALLSIEDRNRMYREGAANNIANVNAMLAELTKQAVEKTAVRDPAVLVNNSPKEVANAVEVQAKMLAAQASLEKSLEKGQSAWSIAKGFLHEMTPFAMLEGVAIDEIAVKYGAPKNSLNAATGRSQAVTWLQSIFNATSEEKKVEFLTNLHNDLKSSYRINEWQAAIIVEQVATNEKQVWGGFEDWANRIGVAASVVTGAGALFKAGKLLSGANKLINAETALAKAGGKSAILAAETAKIVSEVANKQRLQAVGVVAGELTGIGAAIDLGKLVSMTALKVLPDSIATAASGLAKTIRDPVEKLIGELQNTIAAKGIRSEEAAAQLADIEKTYSRANNPNIHSVDPFTLSADGTIISGKVYYKPLDGTAFFNEAAATNYIKAIDPDNKLGLKIVADTTNTSFLVEQSVKENLLAQKAAREALILEEINKAKKVSDKKAATLRKISDKGRVTTLLNEAELVPDLLKVYTPTFRAIPLIFESDIDKAAFHYATATTSDADKLVSKMWLQKRVNWSEEEITRHGELLRKGIRTDIADAVISSPTGIVKDFTVVNKTPIGRPESSASQTVFNDDFFKALKDHILTLPDTKQIGSALIGKGVHPKISSFISKLGKALGMDSREVIILQYDELERGATPQISSLHHRMKVNPGDTAHHYTLDNKSIIVMRKNVNKVYPLTSYMETFAHEYGHAFESQFFTKYFGIINASFNKWLRAKGITYTGEGSNKVITDMFPPEALLEYRNVTSNRDWLVGYIDKWFAGDIPAYKNMESQLHDWTSKYGEFFAENFSVWAFSDKIPTDILGQTFKNLVDGFKLIVETINAQLRSLYDTAKASGNPAFIAEIGKGDLNINAMMNQHIVNMETTNAAFKIEASASTKVSKKLKPSLDTLQKELDAINADLNAIDDAEKGLKTGWLVSQPVERKLDYSIIGKYSDEDINSASRFALGDWAFSTSKALYQERLVGINQQSRYIKLLTNYVRPSIEKLNKVEMVALNDVLVLGDKEGKIFSQTELAGHNMSPNARDAYYKVRATRDILYQMRNDVAVKSMFRQGYTNVISNLKFDDGAVSFFGKTVVPAEGTTVYLADEGKVQRIGSKFLEEAKLKGYVFYTAVEPVMLNGKLRKTFAMKEGAHTSSKIESVIPYRVGEYRRLYSDEYFVKIVSEHEIDGVTTSVTTTHRTASNVADANGYVKAFNEAVALHKEGRLTLPLANSLMQPYGWKGEDIIKSLDNGEFGRVFKMDVRFNRTEDDFVKETIGMSSNYSSKRGDKVNSVFGADTVNVVNPLDSIASEIGNTAYVASTTEWRESHIQRWFNTFSEDLQPQVRAMSPEGAFIHMLNNKGMYVGQSKRMAVAEKVQDYIIAQMNIATKEEKNYLGAMRLISEGIESGVGGGKAVVKLGIALRATKDYPTWMRTIAFHSFFAFNPVQFFMQGMNAFNAVAISPLHGMKSAKASALYAGALFSDQESIWRAYAKTHKMTSLGLGMAEDEFVEVVRAIRRTGIMDGINSTSMYGAETGKYGIFNKLTRRIGDVAATPFNAGEGYSRLVSFDIARREFMEVNKGAAWWTDDSLATILKRQDDLTQNMTRANVATWQTGWKSIPAQFTQYQVKLMMNVVQSLLGNSRAFTKPEAIQLLVTHAAVMGTAGTFLWPFRDLITDVLPEDMTEAERITVQQGVVAGMIASATDGEVKLAIGSRFNTFKYYEDIVKGLLDPQKSFMEVAAGPSGFAALRLLGGFGEAASIVVKAPMTMSTLQIALGEIGKGVSSFNNVEKARIALANFNQVQSGAGGAMYRVTDKEAFFIAMGIPPVQQEDLSIMYSSKKAHDTEIKKAGKEIGKHAMLSLTALNNKDDEGYKTHAAVVQAILNTYTGSDLLQLYKEAYKVDAFTQYEKLVTDQAIKEWKVKDFVVNKGNK